MREHLLDNEIHVYGIQRTGQHAIVSWLIGHFDEVGFKNCMSSENERRKKVGIQPPYWFFEKGEEDWVETMAFPNVHNFIFGTEFTNEDFQLNTDLCVQKDLLNASFSALSFSKQRNDLMVIRNPYNHYASVLNWKYNARLKKPHRFKKYWKQYAKIFLGEESKLPENRIGVVFDKWFAEEEYRKNLSSQLGLEFTDERLNTVMKIGYRQTWGSSFDNMQKKSEAQKMNVLNRRKNLEKEHLDHMKKIEEDVEIAELWEQINAK